jgi:hypothetical protein
MRSLANACAMTENTQPGYIYDGLMHGNQPERDGLLFAYKIHLHARRQMLATSNGEEVRE